MTGTRGSFELAVAGRRGPRLSHRRGIGSLAAAVALLLASTLTACSSATTAAPSENAEGRSSFSRGAGEGAVPVATSTAVTPAATPTATPPRRISGGRERDLDASAPTSHGFAKEDSLRRRHPPRVCLVPGRLTIRVRTTVRWTSDDGLMLPYRVKAGGAGRLASESVGREQSASATRSSPAGSFAYICSIHPDRPDVIVHEVMPLAPPSIFPMTRR